MNTAKTYLVTGSERDIGRATAIRLAAPGSFAIVHGVSSGDAAEETLARIRDAGGDGVVLVADFTAPTEVARFAADAINRLGGRKLDVLAHNAAFTSPAPIGGAAPSTLGHMLAVNVLAPAQITDALAAHLADGASIVAMSVALRHVFSPDFGFFFATKAAVDVLVRHWAVGLGARQIRANAVASGVVEVNFRAEMLKDGSVRSALERDTALGRVGQVPDVVEAVAFLASPEAAWVTGHVLDASGGWRL